MQLKTKVTAQICSSLNCSIPPSLFGAAVLMGNRSSNKASGCRSIRTLSLWFLSLKDTNTTDTESNHVCQAHTMDPTRHLCPGGWAFQFCVAFTVHLSMIYDVFVWIQCLCWHMFITNTLTVCAPVSLQESEFNYGEEETYEDPQPLNCSTTESIKGGHVTYSQVQIMKWIVNWSFFKKSTKHSVVPASPKWVFAALLSFIILNWISFCFWSNKTNIWRHHHFWLLQSIKLYLYSKSYTSYATPSAEH